MATGSIRKRAMRKYVLEAAIAISVLFLIVAAIIPYFLHRQRRYSLVIDSCDNLEQWETQAGLWVASDGIFTALPNPDGTPNWLLKLRRPIDAELLEYPVTLRFDLRFPDGPPHSGSCWIGIGFGAPTVTPQTLDSPPLTPSLATTLRFEQTEFLGLFCYSQEKGWQKNRPFSKFSPGKTSTLDITRITTFPTGMNITATGIYTTPPINLSQIIIRGEKYEWPPDNWFRVNSILSKPDFLTGELQHNGLFFQIDGMPLGLNVQSEMPATECFLEPRKDLVLFVYQSYEQVTIQFDNFRMSGRQTPEFNEN